MNPKLRLVALSATYGVVLVVGLHARRQALRLGDVAGSRATDGGSGSEYAFEYARDAAAEGPMVVVGWGMMLATTGFVLLAAWRPIRSAQRHAAHWHGGKLVVAGAVALASAFMLAQAGVALLGASPPPSDYLLAGTTAGALIGLILVAIVLAISVPWAWLSARERQRDREPPA